MQPRLLKLALFITGKDQQSDTLVSRSIPFHPPFEFMVS